MKTLALSLLLFVTPVQAQLFISDFNALPPGPVAFCEDCNVYDVEVEEVATSILRSAYALWKLCKNLGENQWNQPADDVACGRGQFHMTNSWGDFATYVYWRFDPVEWRQTLVAPLYIGAKDPLGVDSRKQHDVQLD